MNIQTPQEELKDAIDFQVRIQLQPLEEQARFHESHMNAQIVGDGHRNALKDIRLKIAALNRCKDEHSLLTDKMKAEALQAFRDYKNKLQQREAEQARLAEETKRKYEEELKGAIAQLCTKSFGLQPPGIPHRKYIRDVNC